MNDGAQTEKVSPKHLALHDAIESMDDVSRNLQHLISCIKNSDIKEKEATGIKSDPSLQDILNGGPDRIRTKNEAAMSSIKELHDLLF